MFFYPFSLSLWSNSFNKLCICIVDSLFKTTSIIEYRAQKQNHCCIWKGRKYSWCLVISVVTAASRTFPWEQEEQNTFFEPLPLFNPMKDTITFSTSAGAFLPSLSVALTSCTNSAEQEGQCLTPGSSWSREGCWAGLSGQPTQLLSRSGSLPQNSFPLLSSSGPMWMSWTPADHSILFIKPVSAETILI